MRFPESGITRTKLFSRGFVPIACAKLFVDSLLTSFIRFQVSSGVSTMKAVIQRVSSASVTVDNKIISQIGRGLVCLVGICESDTTDDADWMSVEMKNIL